MIFRQYFRAGGAIAFFAAIAVSAFLVRTTHVQADNDDRNNSDARRIRIGLEGAPVPLNLKGKNPDLVGLGSYIVNFEAGCNGCHSAGPQTEFAPGGNPFFGERPEITNPATYLGGGRNFGTLQPNTPAIISRNLTPDKTGKPIGGDSFEKFRHTIKTGIDPDHLHPPCSATVTTDCLHGPFDGDLLQIMPWWEYRRLTEHDLLAIYVYLSAVPCVAGPHNECE